MGANHMLSAVLLGITNGVLDFAALHTANMPNL